MKLKEFIVLFSFFIILVQCMNPIKEASRDKTFSINVDSAQDFIDLKLSDIADSFRLVRLETSDKSIISASDYYVSDKYIIAFSQDGYYKFASDGKFIKKMLGYGRGPDEISGFLYAYFYDENNDLLYLEDVNLNQKLLVYDLNLDKFVTPIKKAIHGPMGQIAIYNDSLIIGQSPSYISKPYAILFQNFEGKFISGIPNTKKILWGDDPEEHYQNSFISIGQNEYRIRFDRDDTLFTLKNNHLVPYIILDFKEPRESPPNAKQQKGDRGIRFPRMEPPSFLIISVSTIEEITWFGTSGKSKSSYKYFFFDKSTGKSSIIRTYDDDFSGVIQTSSGVIPSSMDGTIKFPAFLKNGKLVVVYQPNLIKKIAENEINPIFDSNIKKELLNINKNLKETDNAILLIGKIKQKI